MKVLVNASNLHSGGGVAVASSVIGELSRAELGDDELVIVVSSEVHRNLLAMDVDQEAFSDYRIFDVAGIKALWVRHPFSRKAFDVIMNVFGPSYHFDWAFGSVMGFAQPWVAFPDNPAYELLTPSQRIKTRVKYALVAASFLLADTLVVEQDSVRQALRRRRPFSGRRISVVSNAVDSVFFDRARWQPVDLPEGEGRLKFGLVARNYPHKNLCILSEVKHRLMADHGISADFYVTLTDDEWEKMSDEFRAEIINVGSLKLDQSPSFLSQLDAVVFPTLLECFSASPIEARAVGTPLFASNLDVIRETVGDYAVYFDPLSAVDMSDKIASRLCNGEVQAHKERETSTNLEIIMPVDAARIRAESLLELCRQVADRRRLTPRGIRKAARTLASGSRMADA